MYLTIAMSNNKKVYKWSESLNCSTVSVNVFGDVYNDTIAKWLNMWQN